VLRWTVIFLLFAVAAGLSGLQATSGPSFASAKGMASVLVLGIALLALAGIAVVRRLSRTPR
jgi:hypothetical protein